MPHRACGPPRPGSNHPALRAQPIGSAPSPRGARGSELSIAAVAGWASARPDPRRTRPWQRRGDRALAPFGSARAWDTPCGVGPQGRVVGTRPRRPTRPVRRAPAHLQNTPAGTPKSPKYTEVLGRLTLAPGAPPGQAPPTRANRPDPYGVPRALGEPKRTTYSFSRHRPPPEQKAGAAREPEKCLDRPR